MAEAAGLAIGILSVASVLSTCLEARDYVQDTRNLGCDVVEVQTQLLTLVRRLKDCCANATFKRIVEAPDQLEDEHILILRTLHHIKKHLERARSICLRYVPEQGPQSAALRQFATTVEGTDALLRHESLTVQRSITLLKKLKWSTTSKPELDVVIPKLREHITELERLLQMDVQSRRDGRALALDSPNVDAASVDTVPVTGSQRPVSSAASGHTYYRNIIDRARVMQGDLGEVARVSGKVHIYSENIITGNARVLQGNGSGADMDSFWNG
jgi:hypothetical protein